MSEKSISVIDSTYYINKVILCSGSNGISEEVLNSLDGENKISVDPVQRPSAKIHFPTGF
jgi:hypothetical protein